MKVSLSFTFHESSEILELYHFLYVYLNNPHAYTLDEGRGRGEKGIVEKLKKQSTYKEDVKLKSKGKKGKNMMGAPSHTNLSWYNINISDQHQTLAQFSKAPEIY